jgi:hypothetical protein
LVNYGGKKRNAPVKIIGLILLAGVCIILVFKFSSDGNIPAFSQNNITTTSPDLSREPEASPTLDITHKPQPVPTVSAALETVKVIKEVKTGEKQSLLSLKEINETYKKFGRMTVAGMKPEDYDKAMSIEWKVLDTPGEPEDITIELSDTIDYEAIEKYVLNLDKYKGVEVSVIGSSGQGRDIYMVKVDFVNEQEPVKYKPVIMMTGSVHAREFAGADYIIKFLNDTIKQAAEDPYTRALLENVIIVAVPLVNPDGREMIINGRDADRKSNANGVDLNRAMPSVNAGQLAADVELYKNFSSKPGPDFFAGYNLGTEIESQAMIKWFNYYVPRAYLYIDLHQYGGITYHSKGFVTRESDSLSKDYAVMNNDLLLGGYPLREESLVYGFNGNGGTFTDYARSVSEGFIYSYALGRMVLDSGGAETPLICFRDLDDQIQYYKPVNENFRAICIEIGSKQNFLGVSKQARENRKIEYDTYSWRDFLTGTVENVLGKEKTDRLKSDNR